MIGVLFEYVDTVFGFYGHSFFIYLLCLAGCFSMIIWTPAVFSVLCACVLHFCITCSVQLSMCHMERRSRNTLVIISSITIAISSMTYYSQHQTTIHYICRSLFLFLCVCLSACRFTSLSCLTFTVTAEKV